MSRGRSSTGGIITDDRQPGYISHDHIQYGDYDNSCAVERANVRYLEQNHAADLHIETGCYGYRAAWLPDTEENRELLDSLDNYPAFDDELVSEIESEIESDYIKDNDDIARVYTPEPLRSILIDCDLQHINPEIYHAAKEADNAEFIVHSGGNGHINLQRLAPTYNRLLLESNPLLQYAVDHTHDPPTAPPFPLDFYADATDCNEHQASRRTLTTDELYAVLKYAAELEAAICEP